MAVSPVDSYHWYTQGAAADARGDAIVAWSYGPRQVAYTRRSGGGTFAPAEDLDGTGNDVHVAMNSSGAAVIVWNGTRSLDGAIVPPSGGPIPFSVKSGDEQGTLGDVAAGIDDAGDVTVFWSDGYSAWAATRPVGGSFGTPRAIPTPGNEVNAMHAAVSPDGSAVVGWQNYAKIYAAYAPNGAAFSTTTLASDSDPSALRYDTQLGAANKVYVAINSSDDAVVSWMQCYRGCREYDVTAALKPPGSAFQTPQVLQASSPMAFDTPVTIDPQGRVTVVWTGSSSSTAVQGVWAATSQGSSFGSPVLVSQKPGCIPDVTSNAAGDVFVVWDEWDGDPISGCQGGQPSEIAASRQAEQPDYTDPTVLVTGGDTAMPPVVVANGATGALAAWPRGSLAPDYLQQIEFSETSGEFPPAEPPTPTLTPGDGGGTVAPPADGNGSQGIGQVPTSVSTGQPQRNGSQTTARSRQPAGRMRVSVGAPRGSHLRLQLRCAGKTNCRARLVLTASRKRLAVLGPYSVRAGHHRVISIRLRRRTLRAIRSGALKIAIRDSPAHR